MIDRFLYFREEIDELLREAKRVSKAKSLTLEAYAITDVQWEYLTLIRDILEVFKAPTLGLQASAYETLSLTIPYVSMLLRDLKKLRNDERGNTNPYIAQGIDDACGKLLEYYPLDEGSDIKRINPLFLATVLDPRLKKGVFKEVGVSDTFIKDIEEYFYVVYLHYKEEYDNKLRPGEDTIKRKKLTDDTTPTKTHAPFFKSSSGPVNDEVKSYLSEERISVDETPENYYLSRKRTFPIIFNMAKDFLAAPAMSAPAERLFSQVNDVITKKRNRLHPETIKRLALLKSWDLIPDEDSTVTDLTNAVQRLSIAEETEIYSDFENEEDTSTSELDNLLILSP